MKFQLESEFKPTGDQPEAIKKLVNGIQQNEPFQTLLGITGSGKTFTMANVIAQTQKPTLILSHNKTLAAQLYGEFKQFFPENRVEYFVSYYDYYQPESYLPTTDIYIEKDIQINDELEKLRLSSTSALLSGRRDVIVVASVSCIYGIGNPYEFEKSIIHLKRGDKIVRNQFLLQLVGNLYSRTVDVFKRGTFRVKGDVVDLFLAYTDYAIRFEFWGDEIDKIYSIDPESNTKLDTYETLDIYPANIFVSSQSNTNRAIGEIEIDRGIQVEAFKKDRRPIEANRLDERVTFDVEMMRELGYCSGIENYSRYFDNRKPGQRPFCLLDYFPKDYLMIIDESHVTIPQIKAMYKGDRARKVNLVEYGFRLEAAVDNRPLRIEEFETLQNQVIYVSATPAEYELKKSEGIVVEQVIRPTGLLDPEIEVRPPAHQIDDMVEEINQRMEVDERVLITTLTKRLAEELQKYLDKIGIPCRYIHSEIDTIERVEILRQLRLGEFSVLIGVNLLREGLDLPEVSLVIITDADKEGFLRDERSLVQTVGRAARNIHGKVIMFADKITGSMEKTISETNRRRQIQMEYNKEHGMVPTQITKSKETIINATKVADAEKPYEEPEEKTLNMVAEDTVSYETKEDLNRLILTTKKKMEKAAKDMDFMEAARLRDLMFSLQGKLTSYEQK